MNWNPTRRPKLLAVALLTLIVAGGVAVGPRQTFEVVRAGKHDLGLDPDSTEDYIRKKESATENLRPGNEARVVWHTKNQRTPYSVVYLHGFSASEAEGSPIHVEFCQRYGCNLYLHRFPGHGLDDPDAFASLTPAALVESAKEAIAIGRAIGDRVILMSSSTGSTLSIFLAGSNADIHSLIMYSPNIALHGRASDLLYLPWGLQIGRLVFGGNYREFEAPGSARNYWTTRYRVEGLVALVYLLKMTMSDEVFRLVKQPFLLAYYYKDPNAFDNVVSIQAMKHFFATAGTASEQKSIVALPTVGTHILASQYWSKDLGAVRRETYRFAEEVLGLSPVAAGMTP